MHIIQALDLNQIQIGCHIHPLAHWLKNYKAIGKEAGYSKAAIAEYGLHLKHIAAWLKSLKQQGKVKELGA